MFRTLVATMILTITLLGASMQEEKPKTQEQTVELDKKETFQFVKAFVQIEQFRASLKGQDLGEDGKPNKAKVEALNKKFQEKATQIIEQEELTINSYSKYIQLLQNSPEFQKIVQNIIASLTKKPAQ